MVPFRSASGCNSAACVEVTFVSSSACVNGSCVEAGSTPQFGMVRITACSCDSGMCVDEGSAGVVLVRDNKNLDQPPLQLAPEAWNAFLEGLPELVEVLG